MTHFFYALITAAFIGSSFTIVNPITNPTEPIPSIHWYTLEEAAAANLLERKNILIDIYSDRCKYTFAQDNDRFGSKEVTDYINKNFYCVRFNPEHENLVEWNGRKYTMIRKGELKVNAFAYNLLNGKMTYPSMVLMNTNYQRINTVKGYLNTDDILTRLEHAANVEYKRDDYKEYVERIKN